MATKAKREIGQRWGKARTDKRDWARINEEHVVRGVFLLDMNWVKSWSQELKDMNQGKRGRPYEFPESLIKQQAVWNQLVSVRSVEGITRQLVEFCQIPGFNDYSTIHRRVRKIQPVFELLKHGFCSASTDGTGMKMHNAGEYRQIKYGSKKKRWIKVTITANPLTKDLLDLEVCMDGGGPSEPEVARRHLENLYSFSIDVNKFWGDGAFDVLELFNLLEAHGTESAIPPRDNASTNANGSIAGQEKLQNIKRKHGMNGLEINSMESVGLGPRGSFRQ